MAIKGKKKHKGSRKARPVAPKREVHAPPKPFLQRQGVLISIAAIVALLLGLGLGYGFGNQATLDGALEADAATKRAAKEFQTQIDAALAGAGEVTPEGFAPFVDLTTAIENLDDGTAPAKVRKDLGEVQAKIATTEAALTSMRLDTVLQSVAPGAADAFTGTLDQLAQGVALFRQSATLADQATAATGKDQAELVAAAQELRASAGTVFDSGYRRYQAILLVEGAVQPAPAPQPGGGPGIDPTTGLPLGVPDQGGIPPEAFPPEAFPQGQP